MRWFLLFIIITGVISLSTYTAHSQEMGLATYQEIAQIIVDKTGKQNVTASITLQSTSIQEIRIPAELEQRIREDKRVAAVILTNEGQCVPGVIDEACIMINVKRDPNDTNIPAIQNSTKSIASTYIDGINEAFDVDSKFHSVFIHTDSRTNEILETSGAVSGKGAISAVYTLPLESTDSMYEKISSILFPKEIRDAGGFYDVAKNLARQDGSKMSFSILPLEGNSLLQLKTTVRYLDIGTDISRINPLEYLQVRELERSGYFSTGFYPVNSLLQVVVVSPEAVSVTDVKSNTLDTKIVGNDLVPTDISMEGWVFDPQEGYKIQGKWIFGEQTAVDADTLMFSLEGAMPENIPEHETPADMFDESIIVAVIIGIVAIGVAMFYLKGYKR